MAGWKKSSRCDTSACVEVYVSPLGGALVRHSDKPDEILSYTDAEWEAFLAGAKDGEFDVA